MGKIIAVANQKGGVGKTTTCVNLSAAMTREGRRVLLCDADPQGNATSSMGIDKMRLKSGTYNLLSGNAGINECIVKTEYGDVIPSNRELNGAAVELVDREEREHILEKAVRPACGEYDFVFIDCPPSLELLTLNALCAADSVLIPVQCEYFALEGLSDLTNTIRLIKKRLNPDIVIEGIVLTMYDGRTNLSMQVAGEVKKFFKGKVFSSVIPRNVRLSEAPSHGMPVTEYDYGSKGAQAYISLAREIIKNNSR